MPSLPQLKSYEIPELLNPLFYQIICLFSEKTSSGTSVLIQEGECGFVNVPLHNIYLFSDLVNGLVAVDIRSFLPFKSVHLLLGNDLAGDKTVVNPFLTNIPCIDQPPDPIEQEILDLYQSCSVTRAKAKKAKQNDRDIGLTDTFLDQSFNHENSKSLSSSLSGKQTNLNYNKSESSHYSSISSDQGQGHDLVPTSQLYKEQYYVPEILPLLERAFDEKQIDKVPVCFYVKNDILMRKWRPPDVLAEDKWTVNHQGVFPRVYRPDVLNLVHETPMSGHLDINKTYHKILNHFTGQG